MIYYNNERITSGYVHRIQHNNSWRILKNKMLTYLCVYSFSKNKVQNVHEVVLEDLRRLQTFKHLKTSSVCIQIMRIY